MRNNLLLVTGIAILIIIIVAAALIYANSGGKVVRTNSSSNTTERGQIASNSLQASTVSPGSTSLVTTTTVQNPANQSSVPQPPPTSTTTIGTSAYNSSGCPEFNGSINTGGGPGNSYLSKSEAQSLIGRGGLYCTTGTLTGKVLAQFLNGTGNPIGNVTSLWLVSYSLNGTDSGLVELVFKSPDAKSVYSTYAANVTNNTYGGGYDNYSDNMTNNTYGGGYDNYTDNMTNNTYNDSDVTINATINGMLYTLLNYTDIINSTTLTGLKGDEAVSVNIFDVPVNDIRLATIVSKDLP